MIGFRSDVLNDKKGQRTGIASKYTESTLYATRCFGSTVLFRPEIRCDHSWDRKGYNNGAARNQFFLGGDLIYKSQGREPVRKRGRARARPLRHIRIRQGFPPHLLDASLMRWPL